MLATQCVGTVLLKQQSGLCRVAPLRSGQTITAWCRHELADHRVESAAMAWIVLNRPGSDNLLNRTGGVLLHDATSSR
jgi:hypothetical protein